MNINEFIAQLSNLFASYKTWWYEPFEKFRDNYVKEHGLRDHQAFKEYFEQLKKFEESIRAKHDLLSEIFDFLDLNYEIYLQASPQQREEIRGVVGNCYFVDHRGHINRFLEDLLIRYVKERVISKINATADKVWLTRGLVAMSIENSGIDFRDSLICLAQLYVAAEKKELNPASEFQGVAQISSNETPRGGSTSMQDMMANIKDSAILKEQRSLDKTERILSIFKWKNKR
jgi:hypothetical protein